MTFRKDIDAKFKEDFSKRSAGEFSIYILVCTAYLTATQKSKFAQYCLDTLQADFVPEDIETLRSLLDSTMQSIREKYLRIRSGNEHVNVSLTVVTEEEPFLAQDYPYDVALSYASEDRGYADALAAILQREGVNVFYDKYEKATLWGQDLYTYLSDIYQNKARYCIIFISQHYATKLWTSHERKAAQARAFKEQQAYILPIRLDETEIPGLLPTIAYLSWHQETAESIARIILEKLGNTPRKSKEQWLDESRDLYNKGYRKRALIASEHAVRIDPYDPWVHYDKGGVLQELRRYKEALASFERAIQLYRDNDDNYIYDALCEKAQVLTNLERYDEALAVYDQAIQLEMERTYPYRSHISDAQCGKGNVFFNLKQYEEAFAEYEKAIHNDPKNIYGYNMKGRALSNLERYEEALSVFDHAIELEPEHAYAYQYKASILYRLKRHEEALVVCERAIQLDPEDANIYDSKGDILEALERHEEAQQAYDIAKQHEAN